MKIKTQLLVTFAAAAMIAAAFVGDAQAAPYVENKGKARKLFAEGSKLFQKAKYAEAIKVFKQAYVHWRNPKILLKFNPRCRLPPRDCSPPTSGFSQYWSPMNRPVAPP